MVSSMRRVTPPNIGEEDGDREREGERAKREGDGVRKGVEGEEGGEFDGEGEMDELTEAVGVEGGTGTSIHPTLLLTLSNFQYLPVIGQTI